MNCPHCDTELLRHEEGELESDQHCNGCGCCFLKDGKTPRPGHPECNKGMPLRQSRNTEEEEAAIAAVAVRGSEIVAGEKAEAKAKRDAAKARAEKAADRKAAEAKAEAEAEKAKAERAAAREQAKAEKEAVDVRAVTAVPAEVVKGTKEGVSESAAKAPEDTAYPERRIFGGA